MVCLILAPELRHRYEQQMAPATIVASSASLAYRGGGQNQLSLQTFGHNAQSPALASTAVFANFFANMRQQQQQIHAQHQPTAASGGMSDAFSVSGNNNSGGNNGGLPSSLLLLQWRVPLPSEAFSHGANVESLLAALSGGRVVAGGGATDGYDPYGYGGGGGGYMGADGKGAAAAAALSGHVHHASFGMPLSNAVVSSSMGIGRGSGAPLPPPPAESLYLFLFDVERCAILKAIDPSFSAEELKLSNFTGGPSGDGGSDGGASAAVPFSYVYPSLDVFASSPSTSGAGGGLGMGRFGILITTNVGPSLTAHFGPIGGASAAAVAPTTRPLALPPARPLSSAVSFVRCGRALTLMGVRRQRVKKGSGGISDNNNSSSSSSSSFAGWSCASLAICSGTNGDGGGTSSSWYDGVSGAPSIATFRVSRFLPAAAAAATAAAVAGHHSAARAAAAAALDSGLPAVMIGLMDASLAEGLVAAYGTESDAASKGDGASADGEEDQQQHNSQQPSLAKTDPLNLPLPAPYAVQLLAGGAAAYNGLGGGSRIDVERLLLGNGGGSGGVNGMGGLGSGANVSSASAALPNVPKCIMMDLATGSLLAAPFGISQCQGGDGGGGAVGGAGGPNAHAPTTPAVYAAADDAEYYPHCPATSGAVDVANAASPITFQLTPPDAASALGPGQPPVAVLRVICRGAVLHTYAFPATRRQLRGLVPVVQISTPNTVVDVE